MLSFFVDTVTLALPLGLTWAAVLASPRLFAGGRSGRRLIASCVGAGLALVLSVLRQTTDWVNREQITLGLVVVLLLLAAAMLVVVWRTPVDPSTAGARALGPIGAGLGGFLLLLGLPDVLLLTVGLVAPGASPFSSDTVLNLVGYCLGLAVVVASVAAGSLAARGVGRRAARTWITGVLAIAMAGQATTLLQLLIARRLVKAPSWLFQGVVWLLNHEALFTYALILVSLLPIASAWLSHRADAGAPRNPAEARVYRAAGITRRRLLTTAVVGFGVVVAGGTVGRSIAEAEPTLSPPERLESDADEVWVELATIEDGHLHRFAYEASDRTEVRFIAIKKNAKAFGVGLDACNVCGPTGYFERDGKVICKLCDVAMNVATIGFKGGCNPIPLEFTVRDARLVVARSALEASAGVFG